MRLHFIVLFYLLSFGLTGFASVCDGLRGPKDLYSCALEKHPEYRAALLSYDIAEASRDRVSKWPNPEVSLRSTNGKKVGENVGGTEMSVTLDVTELFIKRPALYKAGVTEEKLLRVQASQEEFQAKSQIIKDFHRYRQLLDESDLVNEALDTFAKISAQYRGRRALGPEQSITLNLVELAQGDYQLKKNHLAVEKSELDSKYKGVFGIQFEFKKELLPPLRGNWPEIQTASISKSTFELQKAEAERERMDAEKSIAVADSWPTVSAGPVYERVTEGSTQYSQTGVNVNVSLPIFSWNSGARNVAEKNRLKAQLLFEHAARKAQLDRDLIVQKYRSAVESLKKSTTNEALKRKHNQIDSLFRQGLSSGGTVIEAHRQILQFVEAQHEHEIIALETLMYLNVLSNKDAGEVIQ